MTNLPDPESVLLQHVVDEDLLAYLDGELSGEAHQDVGHHLARCWDCRTRLAATQARIESFMHVRRSLSPDVLMPSERALASFRERLAARAGDRSARSVGTRLQGFPARARSAAWLLLSPSRPAFALLAIAAVAVVAFVSWFNTPLSAEAALAKAEAREAGTARRSNTVVKNVIQIDRVDAKTGQRKHVSVLSTLTDSASPALSISLGTPEGTLEQEVLASDEHLLVKVSARIRFGQNLTRYAVSQRWVPGLSVAEYRKLIRDRGLDSAFVAEADGFVELRHPFRPGHPSGVLETRLRLDARTWTPTEIAILTVEQGELQEHRLTRTGLEFLARTNDLAALFASVGARGGMTATPDSRSDGPAAPRRRPLPLSYSDSVATPTEVAVAVALHEAKADLGEEVNVFQMSDGSLLVQGLLDHASRKQEIARALATVAGPIRVDLVTPGSRVDAARDLFEPPWRSSLAEAPSLPAPDRPPLHIADFSGATVPMYSRLHAHFVRPRSRGEAAAPAPADIDRTIAEFVTHVVRRSTEMLFHAWALRKLELQFSDRRVQSLPGPSRSDVDALRLSHHRSIATAARELAASLETVAPATERLAEPLRSPDGASPGRPGDDGARGVLRICSEQNELVRSLFTASAAPADPSSGLARLRTVLRQLEPGS
jgi:hypothetical protein